MSGSAPVNILYLEGNIDGTIGGSYYCLLYLVAGLDRTRFEPMVLFHFDHTLVPAFHNARVKTLIWPKPKPFSLGRQFEGRSPILKPARYLALRLQKALNLIYAFVFQVIRAAWFIRRQNIRIVHLNNSIVYSHEWMLAAKLAGVSCITHERAMGGRFTRLARFLAKRLDTIICVSEAVRRNMQKCNVDFGNLVTIYDGLDPGSIGTTANPDDLRASLGIESDSPVVGMVGNIKEWKGQHTLVQAIARVRHLFPTIRCLLVGATARADAQYERHLRELVVSLKLERHIVFTGFQRHVSDFYQLCDVVVVASTVAETFGMVTLEAMANKKPVVASRIGALPEIVEEGSTGFLFSPNDADQLAHAISRLIADRGLSQQFGESGFCRLVKHFNTNSTIDAVELLYERLLGSDADGKATSRVPESTFRS